MALTVGEEGATGEASVGGVQVAAHNQGVVGHNGGLEAGAVSEVAAVEARSDLIAIKPATRFA